MMPQIRLKPNHARKPGRYHDFVWYRCGVGRHYSYWKEISHKDLTVSTLLF